MFIIKEVSEKSKGLLRCMAQGKRYRQHFVRHDFFWVFFLECQIHGKTVRARPGEGGFPCSKGQGKVDFPVSNTILSNAGKNSNVKQVPFYR